MNLPNAAKSVRMQEVYCNLALNRPHDDEILASGPVISRSGVLSFAGTIANAVFTAVVDLSSTSLSDIDA
jgi:hypothetical protein